MLLLTDEDLDELPLVIVVPVEDARRIDEPRIWASGRDDGRRDETLRVRLNVRIFEGDPKFLRGQR